jgi:hypothetical protein
MKRLFGFTILMLIVLATSRSLAGECPTCAEIFLNTGTSFELKPYCTDGDGFNESAELSAYGAGPTGVKSLPSGEYCSYPQLNGAPFDPWYENSSGSIRGGLPTVPGTYNCLIGTCGENSPIGLMSNLWSDTYINSSASGHWIGTWTIRCPDSFPEIRKSYFYIPEHPSDPPCQSCVDGGGGSCMHPTTRSLVYSPPSDVPLKSPLGDLTLQRTYRTSLVGDGFVPLPEMLTA